MICRTATQMPESAKEKLSMFCHVSKDQVICLPDVNTIYKIPLVLYQHKLAQWFQTRMSLDEVSQNLNFNYDPRMEKSSEKPHIMQKWIELVEK